MIEVRTQGELDAALRDAASDIDIVCVGDGWFEVWGQATVSAWGQATVSASDQATVRASGQATVSASGQATVSASGQATVRASGQATVSAWGQATVSAWGQATVSASDQATVRAWGQATVSAWGQATVSAWGQATVSAWGQATVRASKWVLVRQLGAGAAEGGIQIPALITAQDWCDYYGASITDGVAILFKALDNDFTSPHGTVYAPGTMPEAPDWDGGEAECGGGLHFCGNPIDALSFHESATRFAACPVKLDEIVVHHPAEYPNKVKAPRVCAPIWEVDIHGRRIER